MELSKVAIIATGGTIASVGRFPMDLLDYPDSEQILEAESLLERIPDIKRCCRPLPIAFGAIDSTNVTPDDWMRLKGVIATALGQEIAGVVVTHGSASLEETAYFLDLTIDDPRPIVVTGAMRPVSGVSSDAPLNLINASIVASEPASRELGTLVCMNGAIHLARFAAKFHTSSLEAFGSSVGGLSARLPMPRCTTRRDRRHRPNLHRPPPFRGLIL
ncbi:asparaginase [Mesorhizobium sp. ORM6]